MKSEQRASWAANIRICGEMLVAMSEALEQDDDILGAIAGIGLAENLRALPKHIRDTLSENLTDEAARSFRADRAYLNLMIPAQAGMEQRASETGCDRVP